jgi:iron complex transport system substrate-binding protein
MSQIPKHIVCLSAEAADWLWRIGAWQNVVGVTAYFNQPDDEPSKPRVSGFSSANLNEITKLNPDLIITFSDVQTKLATELKQRGFNVFSTDQRTLAEIEQTLARLGRIVDRENESKKLLKEFRERLAPMENVAYRPRVYFEEWNAPLISGIAWISELIERAGGEDIFPDLRTKRAAIERAVESEKVCEANPEIIFASWCGEPVQVSQIQLRSGWSDLPAVRENHIYEISGDDVLQPGFRLIYGYEKIKQHLRAFTCDVALSH